MLVVRVVCPEHTHAEEAGEDLSFVVFIGLHSGTAQLAPYFELVDSNRVGSREDIAFVKLVMRQK